MALRVIAVLVALTLAASGCMTADQRPGGRDRTSQRHDGKPRARAAEAAPSSSTGGRKPTRRTYLVARIVDGDTLELGNGETVRLAGIDTPELGECGFERAADMLASLALGEQVTLGRSDEDRDFYGRLPRYVDVGQVDAGLRLIRSGLAVARYDSRDGYGYHPREPRYVAADRASHRTGCP